jgi:Beta propeller domain
MHTGQTGAETGAGKGAVWRILLATALLASSLLSGCGGSSGEATPPPQSSNDAALAVSRPGELLAYSKDKLRARLAQRRAAPGLSPTPIASPGIAAAPSAAGDVLLRSGTTLQEAGVDEDDLIKSDGEFIYTLDNSRRSASTGQPNPRLQAHRRLANGSIEATATLDLPAETNAYAVAHGMQFAAPPRRMAVLSESVTLTSWPQPCGAVVDCVTTLVPVPAITSSKVQVQVVEAGAAGELVTGERISVSGRLVGTRLIGNMLYVVSVHAPQLALETLPADAPDADREALLARLSTADLLPTISSNGAPAQALVADTDCYVQPRNASLGLEVTTITAFDLGSAALTRRSRCIVGGGEALYMSASSLVLATTRWDYTPATGNALLRYPAQITTDLHKFALDASGVSYRGSGTVVGHLGWDPQRKAYRISEYNADLRVLSFTGEFGWGALPDAGGTPASPATLTVLREQPTELTLKVIAQLPNTKRPAPLGKPGEQVYAVRFLGDRAYVVTFRQADPLYVIDLANPADPQTVGELLVPGFSDALFPLDNGLLFGVGKQASASGVLGGVKVALFDVKDPALPRELNTITFGERGSSSGVDFGAHGLNLLSVGTTTRIALPLFVLPAAPALPQQGLQRFEVDTAARTLKVKPLIPASTPNGGTDVWAYDLWAQRSLQIGAQVYYFSQGQLSAWDW